MPPSFIRRISRSSSGLVTAGPNHHQRIMMRASSGGLRNEDLRSSSGAAIDLARPTENKITTVANPLPQCLYLIVICLRSGMDITTKQLQRRERSSLWIPPTDYANFLT